MDRKIIYPGQIPLSAQVLQQERNELIGLGWMAQTVLGTSAVVDGLDCIPTIPASLNVQVLPGTIFEINTIDSQPFGGASVGLPADTRNVVKQGINLDTSIFTLTPPVTVGQATNYLVQAQLNEEDVDNTPLPYYNSTNPSLPFVGPNNSGVSQPTTRRSVVALSVKAGVPATAGTQLTPNPDPGYVGLYAVTVAYGATTLDSNKISRLGSAPFLFKKLPELPAWVQGASWLWASADTGTANGIVATVNPPVAQYTQGQLFIVKKRNLANTGNLTANFGAGPVSVLDMTGAQVGSGNAGANYVMMLAYDGANFRWINGSVTNTTVSSITALSGEGITVAGDSSVNLNFPGLTSGAPTALDIFAFFDNEGGHHLKIKWADLLAMIVAATPTPVLSAVAPIMMVEQRRQNLTAAPTLARNSWTTRPLNNVIENQITGASLAASQITLPAGKYRVNFLGTASNAGHHRCRLQNITNNTTLGRGHSADSHSQTGNGDSTLNSSSGICWFTLAAPAVIELQTYYASSLAVTARMGDTEDQDIGAGNFHVDGWVEIIKEN